jgi:c-di-GMP-binding flagellar brake protein YcgR
MASDLDKERYYSSPADIYSVLRVLLTEHSSVSIQFENSNIVSASMVLVANLPERTFQLDEFSTADAHKHAIARSSFTLRASVNGILVLAKNLRVVRASENRDGVYYEVNFPESLLYLQRRDAFRAWVPGTLMANIECKNDNYPNGITGRMQNMSATGFRLVVDGKVAPVPEMMENFQIETLLPLINKKLNCEANAIYSHYLQERNQTIFGFRFGEIGREEKLMVGRFVSQLQRKAIT